MAAKLTAIDKRLSPSPDAYNIPSKVVENSGKSFGLKFKSCLTSNSIAPGPG